MSLLLNENWSCGLTPAECLTLANIMAVATIILLFGAIYLKILFNKWEKEEVGK